jgi:hypothetical protein
LPPWSRNARLPPMRQPASDCCRRACRCRRRPVPAGVRRARRRPGQLPASRGLAVLPPVGPHPVHAGPALPGRTVRQALEGAARGSQPPSRLAKKARRPGYRPPPIAWGVMMEPSSSVTAPGRERARRPLRATNPVLEGKRCSCSPTRSWSRRWRASCRAMAGMELVEVGTPLSHRHHMAAELALLPRALRVSEGQDVERQIDRCRAANRTSWSADWGLPIRWRPKAGDQVVHRTRVHTTAGLRAGRRPGRTDCPAADPPQQAERSSQMQLTIWTYEGPPHVGAMRIAIPCEDVHYVLHAPQGDTYADLLFTMIERNKQAPAGHLHHLPGARSWRGHGRNVQGPRRVAVRRAVQAPSAAGRRILHGRADPGRPRRSGQDAGLEFRWCPWSCRPTRRRKTGALPRPFISWSGRLLRAASPKRP